jgi:hypothetical protein
MLHYDPLMNSIRSTVSIVKLKKEASVTKTCINQRWSTSCATRVDFVPSVWDTVNVSNVVRWFLKICAKFFSIFVKASHVLECYIIFYFHFLLCTNTIHCGSTVHIYLAYTVEAHLFPYRPHHGYDSRFFFLGWKITGGLFTVFKKFQTRFVKRIYNFSLILSKKNMFENFFCSIGRKIFRW